MNSAQQRYTIRNYFGQQQYWIFRNDDNLATSRWFATQAEAESYAQAMDPANFR